MLSRTGVAPYDDDVNYVGWPALIEPQFHRIGGATLPWALAQSHGLVAGLSHWIGGACVAAALAAICLPCVRHRAAWAALALCGWGWTLLACISPEGIGGVGMIINFAVALSVSAMTDEPPDAVRALARRIRTPR